MPTNDSFQGVSNCYVFKSRLQEYAQKVGLATPVYDTIKEGPSHEPSFRSSVVLNDIKYDSLLGFTNRKAAEQSAAEVALNELAKSGDVSRCISQPVHETGLCKNLLQEYAQKMNYAIPLYQCQKDETPGRAPLFSCTVEIGGIRYIGAAAKTKKEAEIKAARTALLAIQSSTPESYEKQMGTTQLTVIPSKKRAPEPNTNTEETPTTPKEKKARFKKKTWKKKPGNKASRAQVENTGNVNSNTDDAKEGPKKETSMGLLGPEQLPAEGVVNSQDEKLQHAGEKAAAEGALDPGKETNTGLLGSEQLPAEGVVNSQDEKLQLARENAAAEGALAPGKETNIGLLVSEQLPAEGVVNFQDEKQRSEGEKAAAEGALVPHGGLDSENRRSTVSVSDQSNNGTLSADVSSKSCDTTALSKDVNTVSGAEVILNM